MFAFLVGFGMLGASEGLETRDLLVEGGEILLYYECEFIDFDGSIIKEGFAFCHYSVD